MIIKESQEKGELNRGKERITFKNKSEGESEEPCPRRSITQRAATFAVLPCARHRVSLRWNSNSAI